MNFGINGEISVSAARPVSVESSTPIVIIASSFDYEGFKKFNNAQEGLDYLGAETRDEILKATLTGINIQGVNCPIICFFIPMSDISEATILAAFDEIKKADVITGIDPRLGVIIAPGISSSISVAARLAAVSTELWATGIIDDFSEDEAGFTSYLSNFSSRFNICTTGRTRVGGIMIPNSALYAGVIARFDSKLFGWAKSHSNRVVLGASDTDRFIEHVEGSDCEARRLRNAGGNMIIKNNGWRTYGFETTDLDPIWKPLDRVRCFYRVLDAIIKANLWAIDREADQLLQVKKTITEFMNELVGNGVAIGFDIYFDPKKNTKATVTAGKFYLTILFQDMPSIKELNIELVYSDNWSEVLINYLNQGE